MVSYRCTKGCVRVTRGGLTRPKWHQRKTECPYEPGYSGVPVKTAPAPGEAPPNAPPDSPTTASVDGKPAKVEVLPPSPPKTKPKAGLFGFKGREASTSSRASPATSTVQPEWSVDGDHALQLFELLDNIVTRIIRWGDALLEVPKDRMFSGKVILHSPADEELVQKKMGRGIATRVTRGLGATTQEEAHGIIESGGVLVLIGGGLMSIGSHVWVEWRTSPVIVRIKEKAAKRKSEGSAGGKKEGWPPEGSAQLEVKK